MLLAFVGYDPVNTGVAEPAHGSVVTRRERPDLRRKCVVGASVPAEVELAPVPETVITEVPDFRSYRYFRHGDDVILVEPGSRRVVHVID